MSHQTLSFPGDAGFGDQTLVALGDVSGVEPRPVNPPGFELLEEVGRGGMGVVYRARDLTLDREVAVKILRTNYDPTSAAAVRFVEEARITAQLQHPGIPAVYQVGTLPDGRPFLAMKLIRGRTLDNLLGDQRDPAADRGRLVASFEQLCQAVAYAHAHGIIHRDLKPHNVMVGAFGEVQVMDWGLAKRTRGETAAAPGEDVTPSGVAGPPSPDVCNATATLTQYGSVIGTPAYMPPEQAVGDHGRVGSTADVFGLGATLCVLLTGDPPFVGRTLEAIRAEAASGNTAGAFARLDACGADPELVSLCKRCLAFDPADRPPDADAVAGELARLRTAADDRLKAAEMERAGAEVRAAEQRKRRTTILVAGTGLVAVLVLGIIGTAVGLVRADRQRREAEAAAAEARRLGTVAAARLDKAVEAIEKMVTRAGTARWARDPSLAAERGRVLDDAVAFYEGFGEAGDPVVRRETARAHRRIGSAYLLLGEHEKATDHLRRAARGAEGLCAEFPDQPEYAGILAEVRLNLASAAASGGRSADAHDLYREAAAASRRAASSATATDETRRTFVACLIGASFFTMHTDPAAAGALIREAVRVIDALIAPPGAAFASRALAAYTYASLATHDFNGGRQADGVAHVRRAQAILDATTPDPAAPGHYRDLFDLTDGLLTMTNGSLALPTQPRRAAEFYRQAAAKFDALLAVYPEAFQYRFYKILVLNQQSQVLKQLGQTAEAKERRDECLKAVAAMRENSATVVAVRRVTANLQVLELLDAVQDGRVGELDDKADQTLTDLGTDPALAGVRYNVACVLAQGSRFGTSEERERRAARAVAVLSELLSTNLYRGPTNATHVAADTDLDPLRDRPDFRTFLTALRSQFPPPKEVAPTPRPVTPR